MFWDPACTPFGSRVEICNIMGVTKMHTTAYHPCCDGQVERQNRTLQDMLGNYVSNRADDWDLLLDPVLFANMTLLDFPRMS